MHQLDQQIGYLRATLEQEKKPVGFMLGAGAPMAMKNADGSPLIPGIEQLTDMVRDQLAEPYSGAIETLVGHLGLKDGKNLEAVLNYVRLLAALPGTEPVRGVEVSTLAKLDAEICRGIRKNVDITLPSGDTPYQSLALWISAVRRLSPTQIFTTNYDLLAEQALERQRVAYFDGFMGSREPSFDLQAVEEDQLPGRWNLLWKLHGSINWSQDADGNVVRRPADADDDSSALVYPSHLKYDQSRRLPYLAMMDRLKAFLRKPGAVLVTCGFSFRDQHINEVLDQSLRSNPTATVQGLLHGSLDEYEDAVGLATNLPNLILLARDAAVVGTISAPWAEATSAEGDSVPTESDLGDFETFGKLLRDLVGDVAASGAVDER